MGGAGVARVKEGFLLSRVIAVEEGKDVRLEESVKVGPTSLPGSLTVGVIPSHWEAEVPLIAMGNMGDVWEGTSEV